MKILIAEDQPPAALYLRRTLEKMGHEADRRARWRTGLADRFATAKHRS